MNYFSFSLILFVAFIAVFAEASFETIRYILRAQVDVLPALMVYTSLTKGSVAVALLAVLGGLWFDSLSANPLGATVLPLFLVGFITYQCRGLLLRENTYAQFIIGTAASAGAPILTLLIISALGDRPLIGWGSLWQWIVMALGGGVVTPISFWLFDRIDATLNYQSLAEPRFRPDHEMKRGRQ